MKTQVLLLFLQSFRLEDLLLLRRQNTVVMRLQLLSSLWVAVVSSVVFFSITQCLLLLLAATLPVLGTPRARPLRSADTIQQILKDLIPFTPETKVVLRNAFLFSPNRTVPRAQEIAVGAVAAYSLSRSCPNLRATELHKKAFQESIKTRVSEDSIILRWPDFEQASWLLDHVQRKQRERTHYASSRKVIERCWGNYISNAVVIEDTVAQDSVRISDSAQLGHELRKLSLPSKWMSRTSREDTMDFVIATVHQWLQMYRKACLQSDPNSDAQIHANIDAQILLGLLLHAVAAQTFTDPLLVFLFLDAPTSEAFSAEKQRLAQPKPANLIQGMIINRLYSMNGQNGYRHSSIGVAGLALASVTFGTPLTRENAAYFLRREKSPNMRDDRISQQFKEARTEAALRLRMRYLKDSGHEDWKDFVWASLSSGYPAMACVTQAVECLYSQRLKTFLSCSAVGADIGQDKHRVVEQIVSQTQLALARLSEPHLTDDEQITLTYFFALILRDMKTNQISQGLASFVRQQRISAPTNPQLRGTPQDVTGNNASSSLVACGGGSSSSRAATVDHHTVSLEPSSASDARTPPDTAINTLGIEMFSGLTIKQTDVVLENAIILCCCTTIGNANALAADATVVSDIFSRSPNISLRSLREKFAEQLTTRHRSGSPPRLHQNLRNWLMRANIALAQVATTDQKVLENYLYDYILSAPTKNAVVAHAAALVTEQNIDSTELKRKPEDVLESLSKVLSKLILPQKWKGKGHVEDMIQFVTEAISYWMQSYQEVPLGAEEVHVDVQLIFSLLLHSVSTSTITDQLLEFLLLPRHRMNFPDPNSSKHILEVMIANRKYPSIDWRGRRRSPIVVNAQALSISTVNAGTGEMCLDLNALLRLFLDDATSISPEVHSMLDNNLERRSIDTVDRKLILALKIGTSQKWETLLNFFLNSGYPVLQYVTTAVELYYGQQLKEQLMLLQIAETVADQVASDTQLALEKLSEVNLTNEQEGALTYFFALLFRDLKRAKISWELQTFMRQEGLPYWQLQGTAQEPGGENEGSFLAITRGTPAVDDASGPLQSASRLAATSAADENRYPIISGNRSSDHTYHRPSTSHPPTDSGSQLQPPSLPSDASVTDPSQDSSFSILSGLLRNVMSDDEYTTPGGAAALQMADTDSAFPKGSDALNVGKVLLGSEDTWKEIRPDIVPTMAIVSDTRYNPSASSSVLSGDTNLHHWLDDHTYHVASTSHPPTDSGSQLQPPSLLSVSSFTDPAQDSSVNDTPYNPSVWGFLPGDTDSPHGLHSGARQQDAHFLGGLQPSSPVTGLSAEENSSPMISGKTRSHLPNQLPSASNTRTTDSGSQLIGDHDGSGLLQPSSVPGVSSSTDPPHDSSFSLYSYLFNTNGPDDADALQMSDTDLAFHKGDETFGLVRTPLSERMSNDIMSNDEAHDFLSMETVNGSPNDSTASSDFLSGDTDSHDGPGIAERQHDMAPATSSVWNAGSSCWLNSDGNSIYRSSSSQNLSATRSASRKRCNSAPDSGLSAKRRATGGGAFAFSINADAPTPAETGWSNNSEWDQLDLDVLALEVSHGQSGTSTDP